MTVQLFGLGDYVIIRIEVKCISLQWRHNRRDGVSNHQRLDYSLSYLYRRRSKKTTELPVTGLCEGNSPVTDEFLAQRASNAENVPFDDVIMISIWKSYHCI